jgi:hypothetical protein
MSAANKAHRDETGVNAPTRDGWRRIRRNARKKGISEAEAYGRWLDRNSAMSRKNVAAFNFSYGADTRTSKSTPSQEEVAQNRADESLRVLARAQRISLHRQFNGYYYLLNHGSGPGVMIRNPLRPDQTDFTRQEVQAYLTPNE